MMTKLYTAIYATNILAAARFLLPVLGLTLMVLNGLLAAPEVAHAQTPPTPVPTVAPVYVDPDWEPAQLEYPVGWAEAQAGSIEDTDRYIRCVSKYGLIEDPVEQSWRNMNCHVRRVVEGIVAAAVGVALLTVAWGGFTYMLESQDESKRGQTKVAVLTTFGALIIALLSFAITGMLDNGIIPHSPWATESLTR